MTASSSIYLAIADKLSSVTPNAYDIATPDDPAKISFVNRDRINSYLFMYDTFAFDVRYCYWSKVSTLPRWKPKALNLSILSGISLFWAHNRLISLLIIFFRYLKIS